MLLRLTAALAIAASVAPTHALWSMYCSRDGIVTERIDPIVNPGAISMHSHTVSGGNAFDFQVSGDLSTQATCSSCPVKADKSNYWSPTLWYRHQNGSLQSVPYSDKKIYYFFTRASYPGKKVIPFPAGFRMLGGNPALRSFSNVVAQRAVSFVCLSGNLPETNTFPTGPCPGGMRLQLNLPMCWDGVNLDSADHQSHVAYGGDSHNGGKCPDSHPQPLPAVFMETMYDTDPAKFPFYAASGANHPWVLSNGDTTGYSFHLDFLNGWEAPALQSAIDQCRFCEDPTQACPGGGSPSVDSCTVLEQYSNTEKDACRIAPKIDEQVQGVMAALPGCNPITSGPANVKSSNACDATAVIGQAKADFSDVTASKKWAYVGCGLDNISGSRIMQDATAGIYGNNLPGGNTVGNCIDFCSGKGYSFAGMENGNQCFCGNQMSTANGVGIKAGFMGGCTMACSGDSTQICGGPNAMSIYQKCSGTACANAGGASGAAAPAPVAAVAAAPASSSKAPASSVAAAVVSPVANKAVVASSAAPKVSSSSYPTSAASAAPAPAAAPQSGTSKAANIPSGWTYNGCMLDNLNPRSLSQRVSCSGKVTNAVCIATCQKRGFSYAGTEYSGECYCGNQISKSAAKPESDCNMPCEGASGEMCGGPARLSVWSTKATKARRDHMAKRNRRHS